MNRREYLLVCLMEECAEVAQAASKVLRFGLYDEHLGATNQARLMAEITDLSAVIQMLMENDALPHDCDHDAFQAKIAKVTKYLEEDT